MPASKKGVTLTNLHHVDYYFARALKDNRLFQGTKSATDFDLLYAAKEAYYKIPSISLKDESSKKSTTLQRKDALQKWIDEYISPEKWQRCLLTLRQNKSRKKLKLRKLDLPTDIYMLIKALAKKQKLTLSEVILKLAKPAYNRLCNRES